MQPFPGLTKGLADSKQLMRACMHIQQIMNLTDMTILIPFDESNLLPNIDLIIKKWSTITAPIYIEKLSPSGRPTGAIALLGSAFCVSRNNNYFLVTAAHVLKGLPDGLAITARIGERAVLLNNRPFLLSMEDDLAITMLHASWTTQFGIDRVRSIDLDDEKKGYTRLGTYISIGYPGSKNGINQRLNKFAINIHGTSFNEKLEKHESKPHIKKPVAFKFNKKTALNSNKGRANPPCFSGTSGGPILEIVGLTKFDDSISMSCRLEGVFLGWHKREKEIIGASGTALIALIDEVLDKMNESKTRTTLPSISISTHA